MTKPYTIIRRFLFELGRYDRNHWIEMIKKMTNLLFVLPFGLYLSILKTEKILQF